MKGIVELTVFESFLKDAVERRLNGSIFRDEDKFVVEGVRASEDDRTRGAFIVKIRVSEFDRATEKGNKRRRR
jgi:hypothetical protein